jgi:5-deoxy-glucuronate isomerase
MLTQTHVRVPRAEGLQLLQRRGEHGARELTTRRLTCAAGGSATFVEPQEETIVVLLQGRGRFATGGLSWEVARADVFAEPATALLVPPGHELRVQAEMPLEAIFASTPAPAGGEPILVRPSDVAVNERGRDLYCRQVHNVFVGDPHARRLIVGETFNAPGQWSSYPPHKHDGRDGEPRLEEMYYYRVEPAGGFGLHVAYSADGESVTHRVGDGDLVLIPYGYHSVSAPPGHRVYYLWAIAGDERRLAVFEDPAFRWVHEAGT